MAVYVKETSTISNISNNPIFLVKHFIKESIALTPYSCTDITLQTPENYQFIHCIDASPMGKVIPLYVDRTIVSSKIVRVWYSGNTAVTCSICVSCLYMKI